MLLSLILSRHPVWQNDLKKEAGLGPRYSFLEYAEVETRVRKLVQEGNVDDAVVVMDVAECFEGWPGWGKAKALRKWLSREVRGAGRDPVMGAVEEGWWRVFRPVDGGVGVLVRTRW